MTYDERECVIRRIPPRFSLYSERKHGPVRNEVVCDREGDRGPRVVDRIPCRDSPEVSRGIDERERRIGLPKCGSDGRRIEPGLT